MDQLKDVLNFLCVRELQFLIFWLQDSWITGLQDYRITGLQDYRITGLHVSLEFGKNEECRKKSSPKFWTVNPGVRELQPWQLRYVLVNLVICSTVSKVLSIKSVNNNGSACEPIAISGKYTLMYSPIQYLIWQYSLLPGLDRSLQVWDKNKQSALEMTHGKFNPPAKAENKHFYLY